MLLTFVALPAFIISYYTVRSRHRWAALSSFAVLGFATGWVGGGLFYLALHHEGSPTAGVLFAAVHGFWPALLAAVAGVWAGRNKPARRSTAADTQASDRPPAPGFLTEREESEIANAKARSIKPPADPYP